MLLSGAVRDHVRPQAQLAALAALSGKLLLRDCYLILLLQQIWDRFDLFGTGAIEPHQLQMLMAIVQYNVPELCQTQQVTQPRAATVGCWVDVGFEPEGESR